MGKRVVFFCTELEPSGAPLILLRLLRYIKAHKPDTKAYVISWYGGMLSEEYKKVSKLIVLDTKVSFSNRMSILLSATYERMVLSVWSRFLKPDIFFFMTSCTLKYENLVSTKVERVLYILELPEMFSRCTKDVKNLYSSFRRIQKVLTASEEIKTFMFESYNVNAHVVFTMYPDKLLSLSKIQRNDRKFIIAGVGTADLRKGIDYFIEIGIEICKQRTDIYFRWIGFNTVEELELWQSKIPFILRKNFLFEIKLSDPYDLFLSHDILLLVAREDPSPQTVIEHGVLGIPTVSLPTGNGFIPIFKKEGVGIVLKSIDLQVVSLEIMDLIDNHSKQLTAIADKAKIYFRQFNETSQCTKLWNHINSVNE